MARHWSVEDLVAIAAAGGGMTLDAAHFTTDDLVRIAAATGKTTPAMIRLIHADQRSVDELVRIAAAGRGSVVFDIEA